MILHWLLLALSLDVAQVPVDSLQDWTEVAFRGIPSNTVSTKDGALHVAVNRSASPLVYRFETPQRVKSFTVMASWKGRLDVPADAIQGSENADDFVLKFGLVEAGDKTLNWLQRRIAAEWIVQLYRLAPEGSGIRRINFYSTTRQSELVGESRNHPLSDLLYEEHVLYLPEPGRFMLTRTFEKPIDTLGLWIASDGDDTASEFEVVIHQIELEAIQ
jgi:hypothetical protein